MFCYWDYLTNFRQNNWRSIVVERLCLWIQKKSSTKKIHSSFPEDISAVSYLYCKKFNYITFVDILNFVSFWHKKSFLCSLKHTKNDDASKTFPYCWHLVKKGALLKYQCSESKSNFQKQVFTSKHNALKYVPHKKWASSN